MPSERSLQNLSPWPKGRSGNPGGRPKRKPISDRYLELAETPLPDDMRRKLRLAKGATYADALVLRIFMVAISGRIDAAREIREAIEGRASQRVEVSAPSVTEAPYRPFRHLTKEELQAIVAYTNEKLTARAGFQHHGNDRTS